MRVRVRMRLVGGKDEEHRGSSGRVRSLEAMQIDLLEITSRITLKLARYLCKETSVLLQALTPLDCIKTRQHLTTMSIESACLKAISRDDLITSSQGYGISVVSCLIYGSCAALALPARVISFRLRYAAVP